jgi:hypothetical protein
MLIKDCPVSQLGYDLMSNMPIVVSTVRDRMLEIAVQAHALANGLQSVAPTTHGAPSSNTSVQYLFAIGDQLRAYAKECDLLLK